MQIHDGLPRAGCEKSPVLKKAWASMDATGPAEWLVSDYDKSKNLEA
jgi:hypothetical protein